MSGRRWRSIRRTRFLSLSGAATLAIYLLYLLTGNTSPSSPPSPRKPTENDVIADVTAPKTALTARSDKAADIDAIHFHGYAADDEEADVFRNSLSRFSLQRYPCVLHIHSPGASANGGVYAGAHEQCAIRQVRSRPGATWGELYLSGGKDIFIYPHLQVHDSDVDWIINTSERIRQRESEGAIRDIIALSVPCRENGKSHGPCLVAPYRDSDNVLLWDEFQTWYLTHRSEWRIYPHISGEFAETPKFKRSRSNAKRDKALTRVGSIVGVNYRTPSKVWNLWMARFAAQYPVRVVTHLQNDDDVAEVDLGPVWDTKAYATYNDVDDSSPGEAYLDVLRRIVTASMSGSEKRQVSMTIVDTAFSDTVYEELTRIQIGTTIDLKGSLHSPAPDILYGHKTYWRLMLLRTRLISDLVARGVEVFLFETDQVWLQDPFLYMNREAGADMIGTLDTQHNVAGNTLLLHPTLPTRKLWREVYERFLKSYMKVGVDNLQEEDTSFVEHDQHSLSDLLLYNEAYRAKFPVALALMNANLFVGGSWYSGFYSSEESKQPVIINNNFISGVQKKRKRAIQFGHWFIDESGQCIEEFVKKALRYDFPMPEEAEKL